MADPNFEVATTLNHLSLAGRAFLSANSTKTAHMVGFTPFGLHWCNYIMQQVLFIDVYADGGFILQFSKILSVLLSIRRNS